jgi:hypothetical protein
LRVWRDGIFALLWENGIKGKCWRLLRKLYEKVVNKVIFGDFESDLNFRFHVLAKAFEIFKSSCNSSGDSAMRTTSSANKRKFFNFDEIFAPIKQLNCLIRLLGEHSDFNHINFGESLWNSVMKPSLTHASGVWMPLSETCKQDL